MDASELIALKIRMEFGTAPVGETLLAPVRNLDGHPRLLVSHTSEDYVRFFRYDLPDAIREALRAMPPEQAFSEEDAVTRVLGQTGPVDEIYRLRWYTFDRTPLPDEYADVVVRDGRHVIVVDGQVVAYAATDAEDEASAEVTIATDEAYRGRGYARQVTASWAADVQRRGKVAFYSHRLENIASAGVARSLGLTHLSDEVEYL